jgi:hypothetical protein
MGQPGGSDRKEGRDEIAALARRSVSNTPSPASVLETPTFPVFFSGDRCSRWFGLTSTFGDPDDRGGVVGS